MKVLSEMSKRASILCQGDAFLLELEAEKAAESSKASRKKKKKKKGLPDLQPVRTWGLRTQALGLSSTFTTAERNQ